MPGPKPLDPSSSPRAMLGAELRHKREEAGLTQEELGSPLFVSGSFIGQLEAGTRRMQTEYAVKIDEILATDGYFVRNCEAAKKSKYPDHFAEAAEAEAIATAIREYAPQLIPGLLQTKAYAWAVCRAYQPTAPEDMIEETGHGTTGTRASPRPSNNAVVVGGAGRGRAAPQDRRRRGDGGGAAARRRAGPKHRVIVQVLPFERGAHAAMDGALKLMAFTDAPPLAYFEGLGHGPLEDDPATVARHELAYDLLGASALSPEDSLALIESVAEDYAHEDQP